MVGSQGNADRYNSRHGFAIVAMMAGDTDWVLRASPIHRPFRVCASIKVQSRMQSALRGVAR